MFATHSPAQTDQKTIAITDGEGRQIAGSPQIGIQAIFTAIPRHGPTSTYPIHWESGWIIDSKTRRAIIEHHENASRFQIEILSSKRRNIWGAIQIEAMTIDVIINPIGDSHGTGHEISPEKKKRGAETAQPLAAGRSIGGWASASTP